MRAKIFKSGNSLAIRLPKSLNLAKGCEFEIKNINKSIILTPINEKWGEFFAAVDSFKGEIKRENQLLQERKWQK